MSLKSELLRFLVRIPNIDTVPERKTLLDFVGFGRLNDKLAQAGSKQVFASQLLEILRSEGKNSLEKFLRRLADPNLNLVGSEDRQTLMSFANDIQALTPDGWNREFREIADDDEQEINLISKYQSDRPESNECPYKGLFAFQQEDAKFFFGRDKFTTILIDSVKTQPLLTIIGNSGMGKSSVVFAGLIPEVQKLGDWQFLTFRPKNNPFLQISEGLLGFLNPTLTKDEPQFIEEQAEYEESLRNEELKLKDILDDTLVENYPRQRLLIVVDQFEELYTLCSPDDRNLFIDNLLEVIDAEKDKENPDVVIVITLRVDFYGFALDYQPLAEVLQQWKPETLIGMSREELESAIEKPAEVVGLKIQDGLTKIILDEVTNNPGELPLLEFALEELWKQRSDRQLTIAAYQQIGGIEKALANYAESKYKNFKRKQPQVKHIFTQLVRFGEQTENTRRLATYEQIGKSNWKLVSQLADNRLVVTGQNTQMSQRTVEVVHEALIQGWERLQQWMAENRDFRKWQDRLRFAMKTWEETGRSNSALLRGALLVEAEDWLKEKRESITDEKEIEFIQASRQIQEQEDIERIQDLLNLSQKELQLKQQLSSLVIAVKAGVKLRNITEPSEALKKNLIERLQQGIYGISEQNQLIGHNNEIINVAFSKDSLIIVSSSDDYTIKLWSLQGKLLNTLQGHKDRVWGVSISPDGKMIASGSADKTVRLWSMNGKLLETLEDGSGVYGVTFSPDGKMIASGSVDKTVKLWSIDGKLLKTLEGHTDRVYRISFSPDGKTIASCSADKTVKLWSIDGKLLKTLEGHTDRVYEVSISPNSRIIVSGSVDETIKLWSMGGKLLKTLEGHTDRIYGVKVSPNGETIASGSVDKTVKLWSIDGKLLKTLEGHMGQVFGVNFSPDSQIIASASADRTVRLWNLYEKYLQILEGHSGRVYTVSVSSDNQIIASGSFDRTVKLWSMGGKLLKTLEGHTDRVYEVSISPDSQTIASCSVDQTINLWDRDGNLLKTLKGHTDRVNGVCFSPDGQTIASASDDGTVKLWSQSGKLLKTLGEHTERIRAVYFSPDGQTIASAGDDGKIKIWSIDGKLLRIIEGHIARINGLSFSNDNQMIASASNDNMVKIWSIDGKLLKILGEHTERVYKVSFSPNNKTIVSASFDGTVKIWSIDGKLLRTIEGHTDRVYGISFSSDGQMIASASADQTVRLWPIVPDDLILDLDVKLNNLLKKGCHWIRDYLKTNPNVSASDRNLCDDYC